LVSSGEVLKLIKECTNSGINYDDAIENGLISRNDLVIVEKYIGRKVKDLFHVEKKENESESEGGSVYESEAEEENDMLNTIPNTDENEEEEVSTTSSKSTQWAFGKPSTTRWTKDETKKKTIASSRTQQQEQRNDQNCEDSSVEEIILDFPRLENRRDDRVPKQTPTETQMETPKTNKTVSSILDMIWRSGNDSSVEVAELQNKQQTSFSSTNAVEKLRKLRDEMCIPAELCNFYLDSGKDDFGGLIFYDNSKSEDSDETEEKERERRKEKEKGRKSKARRQQQHRDNYTLIHYG